jgi:hypothetical protein
MAFPDVPTRVPDDPVRLVSVVLPAAGAPIDLEVVREYDAALEGLPAGHEFLLVSDGGSAAACDALADALPSVRSVRHGDARWGAAVRAGLAAAGGDVLCFTNLERTSPDVLREVLDLAVAHPGVVLRANRRTRDTWPQRVGSLLFNLECRLFLRVLTWDINGTPKVFPRRFSALLNLRRDDDLLDAEFAVVCERERYPTLEVPVDARPRAAAPRTLSVTAAARIYLLVPTLRRGVRVR